MRSIKRVTHWLPEAAALMVLLLVGASNATGAPVDPSPPRTDLSELSDEFNGQSVSPKWTSFAERYGWPNRLRAMDVGKSGNGMLHLEPYHGAWVRDRNASFLFQTVEGDFDVRARVRVRGNAAALPGGTWSLGGIMARFPNGLDAKSWQPRRENWHFITTGIASDRTLAVTETKGTYNSYSSLKLRPIRSGWVELRLVRTGMMLFALARPDGEKRWQVRDRFYRMELHPFMQVGLIGYTTSDDVPAAPENAEVENRTLIKDAKVDMVMEVDWIRFSRPAPAIDWNWETQVHRHPLADTSLTDQEILRALGD